MKFETQIQIFDKLADHYESELKDDLKAVLRKVKKQFEKVLAKHAEDYSLKSENPIYTTNYFKVIGRVKSKSSFKEKLIRKNLGLELLSNHNLEGANFELNKSYAELDIKKFDDIVGLRIVCDLHKDCSQVLELIKNNRSDLESKKIIFLKGEVESQPQRMKNGLDIFRLKGLYDNRVGFELQIKSKIEEAWGELDHFIFYKDYTFFPTKTTVQKTMNNVGTLLNEIETLLFDLRGSKEFYKDGLSKQESLEKIDAAFGKTLETSLGFKYQLEKLSSIIQNFIFDFKSKLLEQKDVVVSFEYIEYTSEESNKGYESLREGCFELKILEAIFISIYSDSKEGVKKENYKEVQEIFLQMLLKNITSYLISAGQIDADNEENYKTRIITQIDYCSNAEILILPQLHVEYIRVKNIFLDLYYETFSEIIEEEEDIGDNYYSEHLKCIVEDLLMGVHFNSNLSDMIGFLQDEFDCNLKVDIDSLHKSEAHSSKNKELKKYFETIINSFDEDHKD